MPSLYRGQEIDLPNEDNYLDDLRVGLGWEPVGGKAVQYDLDASIFLLGRNNRVRSDRDLVFYNQMKSENEAVAIGRDNRTGQGEGDDEYLLVNLSKVPEDVHKLAITVSIYSAEERRQDFSQIANAYVRLANQVTQKELARYDLMEHCTTETCFIFGEITRKGPEAWSFTAIGQGYAGGLQHLCDYYGVQVEDEG